VTEQLGCSERLFVKLDSAGRTLDDHVRCCGVMAFGDRFNFAWHKEALLSNQSKTFSLKVKLIQRGRVMNATG
jgi:hypothetical protein